MLRVEDERVCVSGLSVVSARLEQARDLIAHAAAAGSPRIFVFVNAHSAKLRRESPEYARLLTDADLVVPFVDGSSIQWAARRLGYGDIGRAPGPDVLEAVCALAAESGIPMYFMGGHEGVADRLARVLAERHPGLNVVGTCSPPFGEWSDEDNRKLVDAVKASGAKLLWLGVSAPKQEIWAYNHLEELGIPIACVGAAFNFNSGLAKRAPHNMQRAGIEWIYRLVSEPKRMWRRYLIGNTLFMWDVLRYGKKPAVVKEVPASRS